MNVEWPALYSWLPGYQVDWTDEIYPAMSKRFMSRYRITIAFLAQILSMIVQKKAVQKRTKPDSRFHNNGRKVVAQSLKQHATFIASTECLKICMSKGKLRSCKLDSRKGYACLFVGHQGHLIWNSNNGPIPCLIKSYTDNIVGVTFLPLRALQNFIDYTNSFLPALQFTHDITEHILPFLDI